MRSLLVGVCTVLLFWPCLVRADIIMANVRGLSRPVVLQGKVTVNPGKTVSFRHSRFGNLYFALDDVKTYELPTTRSIATRKLKQAEGDVEACLEAARWALHHGLLKEFYIAASAAWKADPKNPTVRRLAALKRKMDTPLPLQSEQEKEIQEFIPAGDRMRFERSKHFLLMHDTSAEKDKKTRKTQAEHRLELLESVYESFMLKFCLEGYDIQVPQKRLKVVLFGHKGDFDAFVETQKTPHLSKAAGFYNRKVDISVFYSQGTSEYLENMQKASQQLQKIREDLVRTHSPAAKDIARLANTYELLVEVAQENQNIEVVSHEATHHMAAITHLQPNDSPLPTWAAEGIATYFESPEDAAWSGIGAVNKQRLDWYRALEKDKEHSNIDFIVSDRIFLEAFASGEHQNILHAYGQAWALTHFLMARHFDKLMEYYELIAKQKREEQDEEDQKGDKDDKDEKSSKAANDDKGQKTEKGKKGKVITIDSLAKQNLENFEKVFGKDKRALVMEWRNYMRSLKTDVDRVLEEEEK